MRHTLNLINNGYKNILAHMVGTDIKIQDGKLVLIFFLLYPSFMLSLDVIFLPVFVVKVNVKHILFELKVTGTMISPMFLSNLGKRL